MIPPAILPYAIGGTMIALAGGTWWLHSTGYEAGQNAERVEWQAEAARLRAVAAQEAAARQSAMIAAQSAAARSAAILTSLRAKSDVRSHYAANVAANVTCLSDDRVRAVTDADRAVDAAAAAK